MDSVEQTIQIWCESDGETIPFGTLTYRVFTMVSKLDREKAEVLKLLRENDLGVSYSIGYQLQHLKEIEKGGQDAIVVAYNSLKNYFRKTL
jgi:hypothetical protein